LVRAGQLFQRAEAHVSLFAAPPRKVSAAKMFRKPKEFAQHFKRHFLKRHLRVRVLPPTQSGLCEPRTVSVAIHARKEREMAQMISSVGRDIPNYQGNSSWMLPIPATFVVGMDGQVKARFVDPDYRKRMAIEDMIGALRSAR
jgi:hypothetical protein